MKQRNPAMDVVRSFALLCVISVHFFLNSGFYNETVSGFPMFFMVLLRNFFMICVPLFMILSGYLLNTKKISRSYFLKIFQTLGIYLLASLFCAAYRFFFDRENFSFIGSFWGLFNFSTATYSWYIEMYIGLFLLIPFLNLIYNNLTSQKHKKLLLLVLLILTALPSVLNIWQFLNIQWWIRPSISSNHDYLAPDWWIGIYPVTFYFIGCYLKEYTLKIKRSTNLLFILSVALLTGIFNYYRSYGSVFQNGKWNEYCSLLVTVQATLVFNYLSTKDYSSLGSKTRKVLSKVSAWTLGAYLSSWVFDTAFYGILCRWEPVMVKRILYFPLIVFCVFVCSVLASALLNFVYNGAEKIISTVRKKN